jgi:hypothetical protein
MTQTTDNPIPLVLIRASIETQERFCIMTVDGGLSDDEALRKLGYFKSRKGNSYDLSI